MVVMVQAERCMLEGKVQLHQRGQHSLDNDHAWHLQDLSPRQRVTSMPSFYHEAPSPKAEYTRVIYCICLICSYGGGGSVEALQGMEIEGVARTGWRQWCYGGDAGGGGSVEALQGTKSEGVARTGWRQWCCGGDIRGYRCLFGQSWLPLVVALSSWLASSF